MADSAESYVEPRLDRESHSTRLKEKKKERAQQDQPRIEMLRQAEVAAGLLMGTREWDWFLQLVAADLETFHVKLKALKDELAGPIVNHDAIMLLKVQIANLEGAIRSKEDDLKKPTQIKQRLRQEEEAHAGAEDKKS